MAWVSQEDQGWSPITPIQPTFRVEIGVIWFDSGWDTYYNGYSRELFTSAWG